MLLTLKREKHLADTHQENSDKIVRDCVEACVSQRARSRTFAREYEWAHLRGRVFACMCTATPACHLCVCVDNVVIDYRRPVVRVAVVTRRLRWLHWVKSSSSSGCLWWPWGVRIFIVFCSFEVCTESQHVSSCLSSSLSVIGGVCAA